MLNNTTNEQINQNDENERSKDKSGVYTRNLYLTYTNSGDNILNGVDLCVKKNQIYALLGPSGCGKTSLLRCILGVKKPNFGDVKIFNCIPGEPSLLIPGPNVGYMPQEIALYMDLTIYEMLVYIGKIFQLKHSFIDRRIHELSELLDLPESSRVIANLSGGQQRRVSFAATVIHNPRLIVLDEPTAGVDPMLREKIWITLVQMKETYGSTFIITTHYIEEARRAEKIGFLRKGRILCEGKPEYLLKSFNCKTLEAVFLQLCVSKRKSTIITPDQLASFKEAYKYEKEINQKKQKSKRRKSLFTPYPILPAVKFSDDSCSINGMSDKKSSTASVISSQMIDTEIELSFCQSLIFWLKVLYAMIRKNVVQDLHDPLQVSFQYFSPLAQVLLFALCIGGNPLGIEVGVISTDFSFLNFSHEYLNVINKDFVHLNYYSNYSQAIEDVRRCKLWGVITFNKFYSHAFLDRAAFNVSNKSIKNSTIVINADVTNKIITDLTYKILSKSYNKFVSKEFKKYEVDPKYALSYIEYPEVIYGDNKNEYKTGYMFFMLPGVIINVTFAISIAITSITLIKERNGQTLERNYVNGVTSAQMIIAHVIGRILLSAPYALLVILTPIVLFKIPLLGSLMLAALIVLAQNICGMACGILVAATSESVLMSMVTTSGAFMICLFTSGTLWPVEAIPNKLRWLALIQPTTLTTEALRSVMLRGWNVFHFEIWIGFVLVSIWIILLFTVGIKLFKMNQ